MINHKIAICTFHNSINPHEIGGISTGPIYLCQKLIKYFSQVDVISTRVKNKNTDDKFKDVIVTDEYEVFDQYDLVIFMSPGLTYEKLEEKWVDKAYVDLLDSLHCNFCFIVNEENDRKIYPYYKNFLNHPKCKMIIFNSIGMEATFEDFTEVCNNYTSFNFTPELENLDVILKRASYKEKLVTSTAKWNPRKRIEELAKLSESFHNYGFKVEIAGAPQNYFYAQKVLKATSEFWVNRGYYKPSELPEILDKTMYHYNFVYLKRMNRNRIMCPRLEIATLEAFNQGCIPLICSDTTPDWITEDSAIRESKDHLVYLPEIISKISDNERYDRLKKFYGLVKVKIHNKYSTLVNKLNDLI